MKEPYPELKKIEKLLREQPHLSDTEIHNRVFGKKSFLSHLCGEAYARKTTIAGMRKILKRR